RLGEINQVVLNLLVNAAHAVEDVMRTSKQRGLISIRTYVEGDMVTIAVADTGGGIPDAIRDRVFDPFFTTKDVGRGTGQGLAIEAVQRGGERIVAVDVAAVAVAGDRRDAVPDDAPHAEVVEVGDVHVAVGGDREALGMAEPRVGHRAVGEARSGARKGRGG